MIYLKIFLLILMPYCVFESAIASDVFNISSSEINKKLLSDKKYNFKAGTYMLDDTIILPSGSSLVGAGKGVTILKLKPGVNKDLIESQDFLRLKGTQDISSAPRNISIKDLTLDGNYLSTQWNSKQVRVLNNKGNCISLYATRFNLDVETNNCAQNMLYTEANGDRKGLEVDSNIKITGKVSGESCMVFNGPGDIYFEKGVLGNCGMRPYSTGVNYPAYNGVVIKKNIEINFLHVYGVFNGVGFVTLENPRVKISHLVSESNNGGVLISQGTWGGIDILDIHANGFCIPTATSSCKSVQRNDAIRIDSFNGFSINQAFVMKMPNSANNNILLKLNGSGSIVKFVFINKSKKIQTKPYIVIKGKNNTLFLGGEVINNNLINNNGFNNKIL